MTQRKIVTAPTVYPVTLPEVQDHCRIDTDDDDIYTSGLIATGTAIVEQWCSRKLITQTWDLFWNQFPCEDRLPLPLGRPQAITAFEWTKSDNTTGAWTITGSNLMSGAVIMAHVDDTQEPSEIKLAYNQVWPQDELKTATAVRARVRVGYGDSGAAVPGPIKQAILLLCGHLYANREGVVIGNTASSVGTELPIGVQALLVNYRLDMI